MLVNVKTPRPPTAGQPKAETYLATKTYLTTKSLIAVVGATAKTSKKNFASVLCCFSMDNAVVGATAKTPKKKSRAFCAV